MDRSISKQQILELVKGQNFETEDEFRDYLIPHFAKLLGIKESQVDKESVTTSFDYTLSNRADIVIRTDDLFRKAIIVIELKLTKSIDGFNGGDYEVVRKQLHKYSQDTRAPYGILLTDENCFIYKNKYFSYDQEPKRIEENKIPSIDKIEDVMAFYALLDFLLYKKSMKYLSILILGIATFGLVIQSVTAAYGLAVSMLSALVIGMVTGAVLCLFSLVFKIFD